jgi:DNA topoisomerase-2
LSDGDNVHLEFRIDPALLSKDPYTFLKLKSTLNTSNIHLFNINGQIQKYNSIEEILREFYNIRLVYYDKRKNYLLEKYDIEVMFLQAKYNFINVVNLKKISMRKQTEEQVIKYLEMEKYPKKDNSYLYLLNLPMRTMTLDQMNKLKNEIEKIKKNIQTLQEKSNKDLWIDDLN